MTDYGARIVPQRVQLVGRTYNDAAKELQNLLDNLVGLSDVTNILLQDVRISEGGGTTTVEIEGGGGASHAYFHGGG